jgi:hypothetical protein
LPIFGADGEPEYDRGIVPKIPGLYFVGLQFLYAMTSETVSGVSRDAKRVVNAIAARVQSERTAWTGQVAAGGDLRGVHLQADLRNVRLKPDAT